MNKVLLVGRTVSVSDVVKEKSSSSKDGNKVTYVKLAVRSKRKDENGNYITEYYDLKLYNKFSDNAQEYLNLEDPAKVKAGKKNTIYSRQISITGRINQWTKENIIKKSYKLKIDGKITKFDAPEIKVYEDNMNIIVEDMEFLDAMPEFAKSKKDNKTKNVEEEVIDLSSGNATVEVEAVNEDGSADTTTVIDEEEIPMG